MTTDPKEASPICLLPASGVSTDHARRCSPWRIVSVVLLFIYGGLSLLVGVVSAFMLLAGCCMLIRDPQQPDHVYVVSDAQRLAMSLGWVLLGGHGCFAISLGRSLWKQRGWRSVAAAAGAIVLAVMMYVTFCSVHRLPSGRQLTRSAKPQGTIDFPTVARLAAGKPTPFRSANPTRRS